MMRSRRRVVVLIFLTVLLSWLLRCGMQEEIFDLAEGSDVILAIGYDTTTKIISLEPELENFKVYDTG
nr:hypothetical protein [Spirochaetota bacterium]